MDYSIIGKIKSESELSSLFDNLISVDRETERERFACDFARKFINKNISINQLDNYVKISINETSIWSGRYGELYGDLAHAEFAKDVRKAIKMFSI